MYTVLPELYHEAAVRLCDAIDGENYFSGTVAFVYGGVQCRLTASVIVCRRRVSRPEGEVDAIADLIPVWWEFHTCFDFGEVCNDFSFAELKSCLI